MKGVYTVIPAVSDPIDIINDGTPPADMGKDGFNWLKYLIMAIGLLIILIIAMPILPWLAKGIVWIISLPFKAVAALCKGISSSAKKRRKKKNTQKDG